MCICFVRFGGLCELLFRNIHNQVKMAEVILCPILCIGHRIPGRCALVPIVRDIYVFIDDNNNCYIVFVFFWSRIIFVALDASYRFLLAVRRLRWFFISEEYGRMLSVLSAQTSDKNSLNLNKTLFQYVHVC